jgi:hypothetical protein
VARHHREACSSELAFLRAVLPDATVERVSHTLAGGRHCAYRIASTGPAQTAPAARATPAPRPATSDPPASPSARPAGSDPPASR